MLRVFPALVVAMLVGFAPAAAQTRPDLSGTWQMDIAASDHQYAFHGQRLAITQAERLVRIDAYFTDETGRTQHLPWDLRIGQWGPRRGGPHSRAPIVQARWDGPTLIMVKSPRQNNSAIWILRLVDPRTLVIETISMPGLSASFAEAAIPREFGRRRFVFRRQAEGSAP